MVLCAYGGETQASQYLAKLGWLRGRDAACFLDTEEESIPSSLWSKKEIGNGLCKSRSLNS